MLEKRIVYNMRGERILHNGEYRKEGGISLAHMSKGETINIYIIIKAPLLEY